MKLHLDCLPCIVRQALDAARMVTGRQDIHEAVMADVFRVLADYRRYGSAPGISREIHNLVKTHTGSPDPYRRIKDEAISSALGVYPYLKRHLADRGNSLLTALKTAATGNVIDSALFRDITVDESIGEELGRPFAVCDIDAFGARLRGARSLLIIADNAGETVFDRVLIESLPDVPVIYAVRSEPTINDATMEDALASGLGECARVLSTGCGTPGILLSECSREFLDIYHSADLIISKGQGNYETLSDESREIFFLLKAKCPIVAGLLGVQVGDYVFEMGGSRRIRDSRPA